MHGFEDLFKLEEAADAEAADLRISSEQLADRPHRLAYSIDTATAYSVDDALSFSREELRSTLHVSIADTGSFIAPDSVIQRQANLRKISLSGTPILPASVRRDTLSLATGQKRPAVTVCIPFSTEVHIDEASIERETVTTQPHLQPDDTITNPVFEDDLRLFSESLLHTSYTPMRALTGIMHLAARAVGCYMRNNSIPGLYTVPNTLTGTSLLLPNGRYISAIGNRLALLKDLPEDPEYLISASFTSPLRRYADLINHANEAAHYEGRPYPFDGDDLIDIKEKLEWLKDHRERITLQRAIILLGEKKKMIPTAASLEGKLTPLLFQNGLSVSENDATVIHHTAITNLMQQPINAPHILELAAQRGYLKFEHGVSKPGKLTPLIATDTEGYRHPYPRTLDPRLRSAMALNLLGNLVDYRFSGLPEGLLTEDLAAPAHTPLEYVHYLHRSGALHIHNQEATPTDDGSVRACIELVFAHQYHSYEASAGSEAIAFHKLGLTILRKFQLLDVRPHMKTHQSASSLLHIYAQKHGFRDPTYRFENSSDKDPFVTCGIRIYTAGKRSSYVGRGKNKQDAKRWASTIALSSLPPVAEWLPQKASRKMN